MEFLVAPTERPPISSLGKTSSLPERVGCDVVWMSPSGLCGIQRKAVMDLIASVRDSRLGMELEQMLAADLHIAAVVVEGAPTWTVDGEMLVKHTRWTLDQQWGVESSIQSKGIWVLHSRTSTETCKLIERLYRRSQEAVHESSLLRRPGPQRNGWGKLTDKNTAIYLMTGIPKIGVELASRIYDHFGHSVVGLTVTKEQLMEVEGIGEVIADSIVRAMST